MQDYEKLGVFYLGRPFDLGSGQRSPAPLLYDSRDLTTHAVCVGMTGSGKTGLGVALIEEAVIDGVPVIAIDPKGDLGNLLLAFPDLKPTDFAPWIDPEEAARKGMTPGDYAARVADTWCRGLAEWDEDGARVGRYCAAAERTIYTPGSSAGVGLSVLRSFAAPPKEALADEESLRDRILSAVSGLLALVGIDADPLRSREHILLSSVLGAAWREGRDLDLATLIREVQTPPFDRVGVMDMESFYPAKERFELAMGLNNLAAAPGFAAWMEGEPLDVGALLHTREGRPRISVITLSHLSDSERMFFVTLLLGEILAWMRSQPGTSSLRAVLYMDEIFGFFPPTANPPSKTPMLTLLKQARAFGLGVVLATQNPVDLDYKGLSNAGTWFVGRLQTERDKARLLDGLEGAAASTGGTFDRRTMETTLAGLGSRVFLMHNVHDDHPEVFQTRWTLSYLRGPLTLAQIRTLKAPATGTPQPARAQAPVPAAPAAAAVPATGARPVLPPGVTELFIPPRRTPVSSYRSMLLASAKLHCVSAKEGVDAWLTATRLVPFPEKGQPVDWDQATALQALPDASGGPWEGAGFEAPPPAAAQADAYAGWRKDFASYLYQQGGLSLMRCAEAGLTSKPGEEEGAFRARAALAGREARDAAAEKLKKGFAPKLARVQAQVRAAEERVSREQAQLGGQSVQTAISVGATILGAFLGRRVASAGTIGRAATAMRGAARTAQEKGDVDRAKADLEAAQEAAAQLDREFQDALAAVPAAPSPQDLALETVQIPPRKADTAIVALTLAWTPWGTGPDGTPGPLY